MDRHEWINTLFHDEKPAFRDVISDLPIRSPSSRYLNRRRNSNSLTSSMDASKPRMSRRGAISYEEDFAKFVRGLNDLVVARTCNQNPALYPSPRELNDMASADKQSKRRSSVLSNRTVQTPTLFNELAAARADLDLLDVNRMCTEANMACINLWDFDIFAFQRMTKGHPLLHMGLYLFNYHNLVDKFSLNPLKLRKFLTIVEANYSPTNCYHNSIHASDVAQAVHCLISDKKIYSHLTPEEILAVTIAALCHDLDHPGVNLTYLLNTSDYLTIVHRGKASMLEHHHFRATASAIANSGLLDHVPSGTSGTVISLIKELILATDVAHHSEYLKRFQTKLDSEPAIDFSDSEDRHLVLTMTLKAADISNPARSLSLSKLWSERIMEEFFRQGDLEKEKNLSVSVLCDRCKTTIPKSQSYFFQMVALPMFTAWDSCVHNSLSKTLCDNIVTNKCYWDSLADN